MINADQPGSCRVCGARLTPFMTFGRMPLANGFLTADQIAGEYFFELAPAVCPDCHTFQLLEQPPPERMFHDRYAFYSSTSARMGEHFNAFAEFTLERLQPGRDRFVVELGSNDGAMLKHLAAAGARCVGVEPSANVAAVAREAGLTTITAFFGSALAAQMASEHGPADAVVAANVMCHVPRIHDVAAGIVRLLSPAGLFIFEDPYLGDMLASTAYDQIYDEHVFMFSAMSVRRIFAEHGLELIDAQPQPTHGGSMRYVLARAGRHAAAPAVERLIDRERRQGVDQPATYDAFRQRCESSRAALRDLLGALRQQRKRVAGYAATSKSTTVLNYCGLGPDIIEFIADTTPIKQGTLSPGAHIPVKSHDAFVSNPPDFAVLFAWNHAAEIFSKEKLFRARGGRWITFVPRVEIIE